MNGALFLYKFIEWIDNLKEDTQPPDQLICSKLNSILTGAAKTWYNQRKKESQGVKDWNF
jgi:hypothetical protein